METSDILEEIKKFDRSPTGSSSCQCTTTLFVENNETPRKMCNKSVTVTNMRLGSWIREEMIRNLL